MNNRRKLIRALGVTTLLPRAAFSQDRQRPFTIGWLALTSRKSGGRHFSAMKQGLTELGWNEGQQIRIEERWANGEDDRLDSFARELSTKRPSLIVANGLTATLHATKAAPEIPVVMVADIDPADAGLVTSLAHPGGMLTGLAGFGPQLVAKHLELLTAAAPGVKHVGFLVYSGNLAVASLMSEAKRSAAHYSVNAHFVEVAKSEEIQSAIERLTNEGIHGLILFPGAPLSVERKRIVSRALANKWPLVAGRRRWAEAGALLSYSADTVAQYRRAAYYVDRILRGTNPGEIPIERATRFEMVINLKTAKALGLTMPPQIMVRATRVIQ